jgi:hypothetical protein
MKEDEMFGERSTPWIAIKLFMGDMKVTHHLEDIDLGGRIILKWIMEKLVMDCIYLAQDMMQWWALVNTVMDF